MLMLRESDATAIAERHLELNRIPWCSGAFGPVLLLGNDEL